MLTMKQIADTNVVELTIDGDLTSADIDKAAAGLDRVIAQHGRVKLLENISNLGKFEPSALWKDLGFAPRYFGKFSAVAVVGDHEWERWATKVADLFIHAEVKFFQTGELDDARRWLDAQLDQRA